MLFMQLFYLYFFETIHFFFNPINILTKFSRDLRMAKLSLTGTPKFNVAVPLSASIVYFSILGVQSIII